MNRARTSGRAGWIVLGLCLLVLATVIAVSWALSRASETTLALERPAARHPDPEQFCTFVTATGAEEGLARAEAWRRDRAPAGEDLVFVMFFDSVAASAPPDVYRDARVVHRAMERIRAGGAPARTDRAAARRVDAYAQAHCP